LVISDLWLVRPQPKDEPEFHSGHFRRRSHWVLPQDLLPDGEVAALFFREVTFYEAAARAAEIV